MKNSAIYILKIILAGIIAMVILSLFSLIYYNPPVATPQPDNTTNYRYIENKNWSFMLEGFGYGKTDSLGYNNAYYTDCSQPDIVFVGSSHIEALQVPQEANCVYLLNEKFDKDNLSDNDFKCFNLGASAHGFEVSLSNFGYIADAYKDAKYIIVEAYNVEFSPELLDEIAAEKFHAPEGEKGKVHRIAQSIPYIRLLYKKINEASTAKAGGTEASSVSKSDDMDAYAEKLNVILKKVSEKAAKNDIKPVILFHQRFWEDAERNIVTENDKKYVDAFKECCESNGIAFIDVTEPMVDLYKKNAEPSYGFANTVPGEGHLNKTGHRIIAHEVYKSINEMEEGK